MQDVAGELPKEMLVIGDRPMIEYAVAEGLDAGIEQVVVIISPGKEVVRQNLSARYPELIFMYQMQARGVMDAVALAEPYADQGAVAVIYPDNIYLPAPGALRRLVDAYAANGENVVALTTISEEQAAATGSSGQVDLTPLAGDHFRIDAIHDPSPDRFTLRYADELRAGDMACYRPELFASIRQAGIGLPEDARLGHELVLRYIIAEQTLLGLRLPGRLLDAGNPDGYAACCQAITAAAEADS
jgi:UTP--glucose-1-phosphate uridylyltransferase